MTRSSLAGVALIGAALGAGAVWAVDRLTAAGDARIGPAVHAYLLAHPEVIPEAMGKLQDRDTATAIAANRAAIVTPLGDAWAGAPRGDVVVAEYLDYNCGFCRASLPTIRQLIAADPGVKVVYRELPILAPSSRTAARVALLAAEQGKYGAFHDAVYAAGPVTDATLAAAARSAGVDTGKLAAEKDRIDAAIRANLALARQLNMSGTPSWVIGDHVLAGALPLEQLEAAVNAARGK